jgi:dethiobiotin synthetase
VSVVYITGTDTGVGKTIVAATLAVALGGSVAVYKPTQAGLENGLGDIDVVHRLTGLTSVYEGIRLAYPMAPVAAASREAVELPPLSEHKERIATLAAGYDHVLVEGAGGLLVALDNEGGTLADMPGPFVVVCRAGLGTLNHTALTLAALSARNREVAGLVIGAWPDQPDEIEESNRLELGRLAPLLGKLPAGARLLDQTTFKAAASDWLLGDVSSDA